MKLTELFRRAIDLLPDVLVQTSKKRGPFLFIGDLHGDPTGVDIAREFIEKTGGSAVFLGDYADRGKQQRKTLHALFSLFIGHPDAVVLLRGNHEPGHPSQPRYTGRPSPYDIAYHLSPSELSLYEEVHVHLPAVYFNPRAGFVAVHGFLPASAVRELPHLRVEEIYVLWSDTDPLSTYFRGIAVPDPWDWRAERVEEALRERGLVLFKGHSPHELRKRFERIHVLFAHCLDTGGYYSEGVRYAFLGRELVLAEEIPCESHMDVYRRLRSIFL